MVEKRKNAKKLLPFFVFFIVLVNLTAKHLSNRKYYKEKQLHMVEEQKNHREEEKLLPFWCSSPCSSISQEKINPTEKKYKEKCLNMVEKQKSQRSKKVVTFLVFFAVLMNLRAKHLRTEKYNQKEQIRSDSKTFIQHRNTTKISRYQRKHSSKYGRKTKKCKKVATFFCVLHCACESDCKTSIQQKNTTKKNSYIWQKNKKITEKKKSCYLFGVLHRVHESHKKTLTQQRINTKKSV